MDELLAKVKAGDQAAEKQIFQILHVRFRLLAKRRVRGEESAKDIAQDACATVLEKYKTEEFTISFEAWAYGVLRMKIGNHFQRLKAERERGCRSNPTSNQHRDRWAISILSSR